MAIPNINQITSTLRNMPDQQLQQYAAMHKSDPYVLSLAVAESNARKQLRASQQAKMAGQQQPTVAEQDIAQMSPQPQLPEEQGIGALAAPNMQRMADGGIAGYGEDSPEQLAYNNEPVMRMAGGGQVQRFNEKGFVQGQGLTPYGSTQQPTQEELDEYNRQRQQGFMGNLSEFVGKIRSKLPSFDAPQLKPTNVRERTEYSDDTFSAFDKASKDYMDERETAKKKSGDKGGAGGGGSDEKGDAKDKGGAGGKAPGIAALAGAGNFEKTLEKYKPSDVAETSDEYIARRKAQVGDDPTVKQMARIEKQEAGVAGEKDDALRNAMLMAGLGMLSGTSQHAFENIGKGGMMGATQYNDAMKDLKKAALARDTARDAIENAAYAYKRGDFDAYEKLTEKSKDRQADYNKYAMSALGSIEGHKISAGATLGAAQIGRENMNEYRNQNLVETIRKNIDAKLGDDPAFKFDAAARAAELERRLQIELQRYPNLVGYAGTPTTSGASGATNKGWGQATVVR